MNIHEFINQNTEEIKKFEEHLSADKQIDSVEEVFKKIETDCQGDEQLEEYFNKMVESCYNYTTIVCEYERIASDFSRDLIDNEEFGRRLEEIEPRRSAVHNATIDSFNILSRLMAKKGKDNSWVGELAAGGRVVYGNYAIKKTLADVIDYNKELNK